MANATVLRAWQDNYRAYLAVVVNEGAPQGNVEYIGSVSITDDLASVGFPGQTWSQLSNTDKKTALVTATKAVRDLLRAAQVIVSGITGTVTI